MNDHTDQEAARSPRFLSVPQAARLCGVTRNTMYVWVRQGKVKAYRTPGRKNLIRPTDLVKTMRHHGQFVPNALLLAAGNDCGELPAELSRPQGVQVARDQNGAGIKEVLSIPEAARICAVPRCTLWRWVREGRVMAHRKGSRGRFSIRLCDLVAFMKQSCMYVPDDLLAAASAGSMAPETTRQAASLGIRQGRPQGAKREENTAILVVDNDETTRSFAVRALGDLTEVHTAEGCVEGLQVLVENAAIGIVHVNIAALGEEGFRVVPLIMQLRPDVAIIAVVQEDDRLTEDIISTGRIIPLLPHMFTPVGLHIAMDRAQSVHAALLPRSA